MTGREMVTEEAVEESSTGHGSNSAPVVLEARGITTASVSAVDVSVHAGEIVGVGGLVGSGRTEVLRAIVGVDKLMSGSVLVEGREVHFRSSRDALRAGVVLVPEDRRASGLLPNRTVGQNLLLGYEQLPALTVRQAQPRRLPQSR